MQQNVTYHLKAYKFYLKYFFGLNITDETQSQVMCYICSVITFGRTGM